MNRKIFAVLLVLVLWASCSYGAITPEQALSDPRVGPFVDFTRENGADLLPGRYIHTKELEQRGGGQKILAPTNLIVEIAAYGSEENAYTAVIDAYGQERPAEVYMALDFSGPVPILRTFADDDNDYNTLAEDYAVVGAAAPQNIWCLGSTETGEVRFMYPMNATFFPEDWYEGSWKCKDGTNYTFSPDGQAISDGQTLGDYTVSDNRIIITNRDGTKHVLFAAWNPTNDVLVLTFPDEETAGVFTRYTPEEPSRPSRPRSPSSQRRTAKPAPKTMPSTPPATLPPKPQGPNMPQEFPEMPNVSLPEPPAVNIDGVWGAYVGSKQRIAQYKDGQYFVWVDGKPSEMGTFEIHGYTLTAKSSKDETFTAEVELSEDGKTMTLTLPDKTSTEYQKLQ